MGIAPETRCPVLRHHATRNSGGYLGALRLRHGKFCLRRERDRFHAATGGQFLPPRRARSTRAGGNVMGIVDHANYHPARLPRAGRQAPAERFPLDFLPPYSPDLNPLQRVWQRTRRLALPNRYFPHRDDIVEVVETQCIPWQAPHQALRKLCAII